MNFLKWSNHLVFVIWNFLIAETQPGPAGRSAAVIPLPGFQRSVNPDLSGNEY
jgi:hypothetical protein